MFVRPSVLPALLVLLFILVLPAYAVAAPVVVNSTGDEKDAVAGGVCETAGGKCTLRAAIEVTNLTLAEKERVEFSGTVFKGDLASTIEPATALPAITAPLEIDGGDCFGEDGPDSPCAGVKGPSGATALTVENANGVTINGLSVTGAQVGISVVGSSEGFIARNDWIGLNLNAAKEGNQTGLFFDAGSDGATIGGPAASERDVIAGNEGDGLDLNGASETTVQGNYFGVSIPEPLGLPGGTQKIANGKDIEITDSTVEGGVKAENNEIGATISQGATETPECDGGCNVISGSGTGIDLQGNGSGQGETPASGPTIVRGNLIGLDAYGVQALGNTLYGVLAGEADNVTIGGTSDTEANYVAGGEYGIYTEKGQKFEAKGNRIGIDPGGALVTPPSVAAMFVDEEGLGEGANIFGNKIMMLGGKGIDERFSGATIVANELEGGSIGIWTHVEPGGGLIAGNVVEAAQQYGILVESPDNEVRANFVFGSGAAGIRVENPPGIAMTGNLIGGNTAERENVIEHTEGPAIEILEEALEPGSETEIARNRGSSNKGLFIDLVNGGNEGILPPTFSVAMQSKAEGTAEPEAKVRVFRKASTELGEVESFLAETVADGSGNWKVTYPAQIPTGTIVAATQTSTLGSTSELATATSAADPNNGGGGGGGNNGGGQGPTPDTTPPTVKITQGPKAKSTSTTAKFKFKANEAGSTFQCKLDKGKFKSCRSPKTYKKLKPGKHVFKVRATDKAGNVGAATKRKFTILP